MEKVQINIGEQFIDGTLIYPENLKSKNPALLFIHGWSSSQGGNVLRAQELAKLGFVCLTIDLRGHGESSGELGDFSRKDHLEDVKIAYDYLVTLPEVDGEKVGVIGASYGGYLAATLANYRKLKWLVLRVPALYFDEKFDVPSLELIGNKLEKDTFRSTNLTPNSALSLKGVSEFSGDILLVESEKDTVIPHATVENYLRFIDKEKLTYKIMKDTPHDLRTEKEQREYVEILKKWFKDRI